MADNPFVGKWSYRSFFNDPTPFLADPDQSKAEAALYANVLGYGTIDIEKGPMQSLRGTIGGSGWSLDLTGARSYGNPMACTFQGKGVNSGEEWIYDYVAYLVPDWPNGVKQRAALVGSIVRAIPHSGGDGTVHPAGVVGSWIAVARDPR